MTQLQLGTGPDMHALTPSIVQKFESPPFAVPEPAASMPESTGSTSLNSGRPRSTSSTQRRPTPQIFSPPERTFLPYDKFEWKDFSVFKRRIWYLWYCLAGYLLVVVFSPLLLSAAAGTYIFFGVHNLIFRKDQMHDEESGTQQQSSQQHTEQQSGAAQKKKFMFITSSGGGTHNALVAAVQGYWTQEHPNQNDVDFHIAQAFTEVLRSYDIFPKLTWECYTGEDLFNWLNSKKANYIITCLYYVAQNHWYVIRPFLVRRVMQYYKEHQPAIVVSAIPLLSFVFAEAAHRMDIPFIVVPADADPIHYTRHLRNYDKLRVVVTHPRPPVIRRLKHIPQEHQIRCNYPVRPSFLRPSSSSPQELRTKWKVPQNAYAVGILMGAGGSRALTEYVKELSKVDLPLVIMPCTGRSEHLVEVLSQIPTSKYVTIRPIGFIASEQQMCEYFDVCDVLILKPGPSSVREALARFKYGPGILKRVLLDKTSKVQPWEEDNVSQCTTLGVGIPVYNIDHTDHLVRKILNEGSQPLELPDLESPVCIVREMEKLINYAAPAPAPIPIQNPWEEMVVVQVEAQ